MLESGYIVFKVLAFSETRNELRQWNLGFELFPCSAQIEEQVLSSVTIITASSLIVENVSPSGLQNRLS